MSEDHQHDTPIKTPKQLITVIVLSFIIPIALIVLLVSFVTGGKKVDGQGLALKPESIAERIKPVAAVNLKVAGAATVAQTGEQVYGGACKACHESGAANAPKFGDAAAWAPRLKGGLDALVASVVKGKGAMPPKGGNGDLSEYEIARAVVHMANASGGSLKEPAAPAAAPAAAAPAAAPAAGAPAAAAPGPAAAPVVVAAAAAPKADAGKALYDSACTACHAAGVAGSPKFGDKAAWAPRIKTGMDALYTSVRDAAQGYRDGGIGCRHQGRGGLHGGGGEVSLSRQVARTAPPGRRFHSGLRRRRFRCRAGPPRRASGCPPAHGPRSTPPMRRETPAMPGAKTIPPSVAHAPRSSGG
jgi:cytochrome c5